MIETAATFATIRPHERTLQDTQLPLFCKGFKLERGGDLRRF
jgi:hypothetical protein